MCGIVSITSQNFVAPARLKAAADALVHRGPDGEGFWISPDHKTALGHRRLSIVDLGGGAQPLHNESNDIHIVVNGEFYGFEAIRADLIRRGHKFSTGSDSEIALHLYEEYGLDCLGHLRGEFAFILYDEKRQRLFAARDRFGIKPLCYAEAGGELFIASEAKAIFAAGFACRWDDAAFYHAASLQYVPEDRTLFKGVHQLKPGHFLLQEQGRVTLRKYWDMDYPPEAPDSVDESAAQEEFNALLEDSIRLRLRADVPVCAHLSGGLDSSAVLGIGSRLLGRPMDAFTISFGEEGYDELPVAEETAAFCGARLHAIRMTQEDLVENIPAAVYHGEGIAINGHLAGKFILNRHIRNAGFKVALTGEGSDETLAGYAHLRQDMLNDNAAADAPDAAAVQQLYATNRASGGAMLAVGEELPSRAVREALGYVPAFLAAKASLGFRFHKLLSAPYKARFAATDCYADLMRATDVSGQLAGRARVNQSLYLWNKLALATYILRTLGDGMEMSHSVEGRLPLLDHKLFECARRLPLNMKIRGKTEKHVLREAAKASITGKVYRREKHPFMAPPVSLFSNRRLDEMVQDKISSAAFRAVPFFDGAAVPETLGKIRALPAGERIAWEPVLMMTLSTICLAETFKPGASA